jgi:hypothetical protein
MSQKLLFKIGYYSVYEIKTSKGLKYLADSGKTIYLKNLKKFIINTNRDTKESKSLETIKKYVKTKLEKKSKEIIHEHLQRNFYNLSKSEITKKFKNAVVNEAYSLSVEEDLEPEKCVCHILYLLLSSLQTLIGI